MSENELLAAVLDLARVYGWRTFHARPAMTAKGYRTAVSGDGKGFPDLLMSRPGYPLLAVELKSDKGRLTQEQTDWLLSLAYKADTHVWRPADWHSGEILRALSGVSPSQKDAG